MKIREATSKEHTALLMLIQRLFPTAHIAIEPKDLVYIAEVQKRRVGFVHVRMKEGFVLIQGIGVIPSYQKQGIGSQLLEYVKGRFKGSEIRLKVKATNPAVNVYQKAGMVPIKYEGDICVVAYKNNT